MKTIKEAIQKIDTELEKIRNRYSILVNTKIELQKIDVENNINPDTKFETKVLDIVQGMRNITATKVNKHLRQQNTKENVHKVRIILENNGYKPMRKINKVYFQKEQ